MGKLFECSMDYLLNEDITEKKGLQPTEKESIWDKFKKQLHERKSEKMIFGMPLYHIARFFLFPYITLSFFYSHTC